VKTQRGYGPGLRDKTLKRVYDSAVQAETSEASTVVEHHNEALALLKTEFPENEVIQSKEKITANVGFPPMSISGLAKSGKSPRVSRSDGEYVSKAKALERVKFRTEQIADSIGLGDGFTRQTDSEKMAMITIEQTAAQDVSQDVAQDVSIETIQQLIDLDPQVQQNKADVCDLVDRFDEELTSDDPDPGTLSQLIQEAKEYSTSVAAKLGMLALQKGIVGII
jgi:hypothetical protein